MKKILINKNKIAKIFALILFVLVMVNTYIYADVGGPLDNTILDEVTSGGTGSAPDNVLNPIKNVYSTILLLFQIAGMAGIVYNGVKYMYAGAEDKAQIKKTLIWIVVGTIFVFAAPSIISLVTNAANQAMANSI